MNKMLLEQYQAAKAQIEQHCKDFSRDPEDIVLLAVSKRQPSEAIQSLYDRGQRDFGESYVNEWKHKLSLTKDCPDIRWHFIGPLQSNKTRTVAENAFALHSLDRLKLLERLDQQRPDHLPPLETYIQVNLSEEAAKSGCHPDEVPALLAALDSAKHLKFSGFMTLPEADPDKAGQRFDTLVRLADTLGRMPCGLSMGMSSDLETAIAKGSTCVRIGTAIFGPRQPT